VPLLDEWFQAGRKHYGVIVSEQVPIGEMLRRALRMLNTISADDMEDGFRNLAEFADHPK